MSSDAWTQRTAVLANGDRHPLGEVVERYNWLQDQWVVEDQAWDVVYHLREVCLGRPVDAGPLRMLAGMRLVDETGAIDPVTRSVVLSSVRGEHRALSLSSPFTDGVDRALAELAHAKGFLSLALDRRESEALLGGDQLRDDLAALGDDLRQVPPGLPDPKSFVNKLFNKDSRDPGLPPPPPPSP